MLILNKQEYKYSQGSAQKERKFELYSQPCVKRLLSNKDQHLNKGNTLTPY